MKEIAQLFANQGAIIALCDINAENVLQSAATLQESGFDCLSFTVDVRDRNTIENMINEVIKKYGPV